MFFFMNPIECWSKVIIWQFCKNKIYFFPGRGLHSAFLDTCHVTED